MRFRSKPVEIEAEQWFPGKDIPGVHSEECWTEIGHRSGQAQRFRQPDRFYVVTIHRQKVYLEPGDYVVTEPDGQHFYPVKPDIFTARWEPVTRETVANPARPDRAQ